MSFDKISEKIPTKEGRTFVGLLLIVIGLASSAILTIVAVPVGIAILAFDYEWARKILRAVRDLLNSVRAKTDARSGDRQEN